MAQPTIGSKEFKHALSKLRPTKPQLKFLQEHYRAVGRVSTMSNLAKAAGYKNYGGVNLQYGSLAKRIGRILQRPLPATRVTLLVDFVDPESVSNRNWIVHMRPAFASALRAMNWVK